MENKLKKVTIGRKRIAKFMRKSTFYTGIMMVGLLLIAGSFYYKTNDEAKDLFKNADNAENGSENKDDLSRGNFLEGVLRVSDNVNFGNLLLESPEGSIYLRTSRDFSALIGSSVLVTIEGTLEKFRLVDIQNKLEEEGFLKTN